MRRPAVEAEFEAEFEAMLRQVLTTDEEAREHQSAKDLRTVARHLAVGARARCEWSRLRAQRSRRRRPGKND
jgi:hypothetical protein